MWGRQVELVPLLGGNTDQKDLIKHYPRNSISNDL